MFINNYPYTDNQQLNLDYLLNEMATLRKDIEKQVKELTEKYLSGFSLETKYNSVTEELVFSLKKEAK